MWNKTLAARHHRYRTEGKSTSYRETGASLTAWTRTEEFAFLSEVSCVPLQQTLRHRHNAYRNFFAGRAKLPRFKTRAGRQSAHFTRSRFACEEACCNWPRPPGRAAAHRKVRNDAIAIEDLAVANMVRNRRLSRAVNDVAWGEFR